LVSAAIVIIIIIIISIFFYLFLYKNINSMPSGRGLDNHKLAALAIVIVNMVVVHHAANQSNNEHEDMRGRNSSNQSNASQV
jgi:predicted membrane protein